MAAATVVSLAIINKNNEPIYMKEFFTGNDEDPNDNGNASDADNNIVSEEELFGIITSNRGLDESSSGKDHEGDSDDGTGSKSNKKDSKGKAAAGPTNAGAGIRRCSLQQQFLLHAALDRFEELSGPPPGYAWRARNARNKPPGAQAAVMQTAADAMFVGLLCPQEEYRVYGYMTTTRVKFLVTLREAGVVGGGGGGGGDDHDYYLESIAKGLMVEIHGLYVEYALNPFSAFVSKGSIVSPRFDKQVLDRVQAYNDSGHF